MIINEAKRFIFIEIPKTGTSSIAKRLMEIDEQNVRNRLRTAEGSVVRVRTHVPIAQVRRILGKRADAFTYVAFLRDPVELTLSKYHFFRQGRASRLSALGDGNLGRWVRVRLARWLPIEAWVVAVPFRSAGWYLEDGGGAAELRIGNFSDLQGEFVRIFGQLGYDAASLKLPELNRTEYPPLPAWRMAWVDRFIRFRYAGDVRRYGALASEGASQFRS